ncbi:MAG: HAD family hydrolase [Alphaproteobacteria bacterium]|nr:HAD family hydrolase [Alphaproteobacteria bacterium]
MSDQAIRIAMWSGPRNISTAMMRSFENRPDTAVVDEPFYAAYLAATGADHPMREEVLASQSTDWRAVADALTGAVPDGRRVFYQKHMTHHMLPDIGRNWTAGVRSAFLIRAPEDVLLSYAEVRGSATLDEIGVPQQRELFEREAERLGRAPPVIDSFDVLADPRGVLSALCAGLGIAFSEAMLKWPAGARASDGVWAPAWYAAVERSTGFSAPRPRARLEDLPDDLKRVAERARGDYERLAAYRLKAV